MRLLIIIGCCVALGRAQANELFAFKPSASAIRTDKQGETLTMTVTIDALILSIFALSEGRDASLKNLEITVTSRDNGAKETIDLPPAAYGDVVSPQLANLRVEADAGVFGHFHWIELPFGEPRKCARPRKGLSRYAAFAIAMDYTQGQARVGVRPQCTMDSGWDMRGWDMRATLPIHVKDE